MTRRKTLAAGVLSVALLYTGAANALTTWFQMSIGLGTYPGELFVFSCQLHQLASSEDTYVFFSSMHMNCTHTDIWYYDTTIKAQDIQQHHSNALLWINLIPYSCPNGVYGDNLSTVWWRAGYPAYGFLMGSTIHDCQGGIGN